MDWVVDTCVLLDILDEIPPFAEAAAEALDEKAEEGELTVAPACQFERREKGEADFSLSETTLGGR